MDNALKALTHQKRQLEEEIQALQARLERVNAAIQALTARDFFDEFQMVYSRPRRAPGTLKQMAYTVLVESGRPMTAQQILAEIAQSFGVKIERTSMSPQLSRLGQDGLIIRHGNLWSVPRDRSPEADQFYLLTKPNDLITR